MRDIRPNNSAPDSNDESLAADSEQKPTSLYEATARRTQKRRSPSDIIELSPDAADNRRRRPRGKSTQEVPIAAIHVPLDQSVHNDEDHEVNRTQKPTRPLFVKTPLARRSDHVRVGSRERHILLGFFVLVLAVGTLAAFIFLPTAHARLQLKTAPLLIDQNLVIRANGDDNHIPGTALMREVQVEGAYPVAHKEIVGSKAKGTVRIINRTFEEQKIKEQSRLTGADGVLFYMLKHAIVPPAQEGSVAAIEVPVEAADAGTSGNIQSQRLDFAALDSTSRTVVYAESMSAFTGGSGEEVAVVSEDDFIKARAAAQDMGQQQAEVAVRAELPSGWTVLDESWNRELLSFETDAKVGDRIPSIAYTGRAVIRVIGYEQVAFESALKRTLEATLDNEFMLFPGPISYTKAVGDIDWDNVEATIATRVTHTTIPRFSLETLRSKLAGRSVQEAREYLEGLPGVQSAVVELWPFWVQSIPRIEARIALDLEPERQP